MAKRFLDNEAKEAREDDSDSEIGYQRKRAKTLEYDEPSSDESVTEGDESVDWTSDDGDFIDDRPASALTIYSDDLPDDKLSDDDTNVVNDDECCIVPRRRYSV